VVEVQVVVYAVVEAVDGDDEVVITAVVVYAVVEALDGDDEVVITPDVSAEQGFGAHRACVEPLRRTVVNETMSLSPPKEEQAKNPWRARRRAVDDEAVSDSTRQAALRGSGRSSLSSGREYEPFWPRVTASCACTQSCSLSSPLSHAQAATHACSWPHADALRVEAS
jgi:hypothetical protein